MKSQTTTSTYITLRNLCIAVIATMASMNAMGKTTAHKTDTRNMVLIPAGDFIMGSNLVEKTNKRGEFGNVKPWYLDEHPKHHLKLPSYYIDKYEVTDAQYLKFVTETGKAVPEYWLKTGYVLRPKLDQLRQIGVDKLRQLAANVFRLDEDTTKMKKHALMKDIKAKLTKMDKLPVYQVTWYQANKYCKWAGERLPSEAEWEKAARGRKGSSFPWGNKWHTGMSNTGAEQWDDNVAPIGSYKTDKSPFGVYDMAGNVSEWVQDWYKPYKGSDYKSDAFGKKFMVVRGAAWGGGQGHYALKLFQRGAYRGNFPPDGSYDDVGFRCAVNASVTKHKK